MAQAGKFTFKVCMNCGQHAHSRKRVCDRCGKGQDKSFFRPSTEDERTAEARRLQDVRDLLAEFDRDLEKDAA